MCGGSASGKTEFIEKFFITENFNGIIFDLTSSNIDGMKIKISKIKKSKNIPIICFIYPDDLKRCFTAFHNRSRKIPEHRFYQTHSGARRVMLWLAKEHPSIEIFIYQNSYQPENLEEDQLSFGLIKFYDRKEMIDFLEKNQYSDEEIKELLTN